MVRRDLIERARDVILHDVPITELIVSEAAAAVEAKQVSFQPFFKSLITVCNFSFFLKKIFLCINLYKAAVTTHSAPPREKLAEAISFKLGTRLKIFVRS